MNFTAKIKSARYKPNYILNVNIDIPLRPDQIMSDRPVSGEFTFSPSQLKKKLKLQLPRHSTKTTKQAQSRKISSSYLGDTLNTIPVSAHMHQSHKRKGTKSNHQNLSSFGIHTPFPYPCASRKSNKNRSEAVSPKRKLIGSVKQSQKDAIHPKKMKGALSNKVIKSSQSTNNAKLIQKLASFSLSQSEDNIIKYTNNSAQLKKDQEALFTSTFSIYKNEDKNQEQKSDKNNEKKSKFIKKLKTSEVLESDEYNLITEMRQFERKSQEKKEHLHYEYLKQKVLVLASVKKIQRAWRNYKTKKLLKSYSHDISLRFTNKMKQSVNSLSFTKNNILTVRSLEGPQFQRNKKKSLLTSELQQKQKQSSRIQSSGAEFNRSTQVVSAKMKFQMEELQKWEQLIRNIRQGKQVEQVLESSFKRKQQLQKDLKKYDEEPKKKVSVLRNQHQKYKSGKFFQDRLASNDIFQSIPEKNFHKKSRSYGFQSDISDQPAFIDYDGYQSSSASNKEVSLINKCFPKEEDTPPFNTKKEDREISDIPSSEDCGFTTQRRRQKLEQFENQIRKIDNEDSSMNESLCENPIICQYNVNSDDFDEDSEIHGKLSSSQKQKLENMKLRKKLQLFNKMNFNEFEQKSNSSSGKNEKKQTPQKQKHPIKQMQEGKKLNFEEALNRNVTEDSHLDKLDTYRQQTLQQSKQEDFQDISRKSLIDDLCESMEELQRLDPSPEWKNTKVEKSFQKAKGDNSLIYEKIQDEMIYEALLEFSESELIVMKIKQIYEKTFQKKPEKPEGICTNLESIKDYLENLVAFLFEQYPKVFGQGLSKKFFQIEKTQEILNKFRLGTHRSIFQDKFSYDEKKQKNNCDMILNQKLFYEHWGYASEQIYFDPKYGNTQKQRERVAYLKQITRIYFHAIFSAFNECLDQYRPLYPSNFTNNKFIANGFFNILQLLRKPQTQDILQLQLSQQKYVVRSAYKKLSSYAVIYCGLHLQDKQHSLSPIMIKQIQEERLGSLLQLQISEQEYLLWGALELSLEFMKVLFELSSKLIEESILSEAASEINNIIMNRSSSRC